MVTIAVYCELLNPDHVLFQVLFVFLTRLLDLRTRCATINTSAYASFVETIYIRLGMGALRILQGLGNAFSGMMSDFNILWADTREVRSNLPGGDPYNTCPDEYLENAYAIWLAGTRDRQNISYFTHNTTCRNIPVSLNSDETVIKPGLQTDGRFFYGLVIKVAVQEFKEYVKKSVDSVMAFCKSTQFATQACEWFLQSLDGLVIAPIACQFTPSTGGCEEYAQRFDEVRKLVERCQHCVSSKTECIVSAEDGRCSKCSTDNVCCVRFRVLSSATDSASKQLAFMKEQDRDNGICCFPDGIHVIKCQRNSASNYFLHNEAGFFSTSTFAAVYLSREQTAEKTAIESTVANTRTVLFNRDRQAVENTIPLLDPEVEDKLANACLVVERVVPNSLSSTTVKVPDGVIALVSVGGQLILATEDRLYRVTYSKQPEIKVISSLDVEGIVAMVVYGQFFFVVSKTCIHAVDWKAMLYDKNPPTFTQVCLLGDEGAVPESLGAFRAASASEHLGGLVLVAETAMYFLAKHSDDSGWTAGRIRPFSLPTELKTLTLSNVCAFGHDVVVISSRSSKVYQCTVNDNLCVTGYRLLVSNDDRLYKPHSVVATSHSQLYISYPDHQCIVPLAFRDGQPQAYSLIGVKDQHGQQDGISTVARLHRPTVLTHDGPSIIWHDSGPKHIRLTTSFAAFWPLRRQLAAFASVFDQCSWQQPVSFDGCVTILKNFVTFFDEWGHHTSTRCGRNQGACMGPQGLVSAEIREGMRVFLNSLLRLEADLTKKTGGTGWKTAFDFRSLTTLSIENFHSLMRSRDNAVLDSLAYSRRRYLVVHEMMKLLAPMFSYCVSSHTAYAVEQGFLDFSNIVLKKPKKPPAATTGGNVGKAILEECQALARAYGQGVPMQKVRDRMKFLPGTLPLLFSWHQHHCDADSADDVAQTLLELDNTDSSHFNSSHDNANLIVYPKFHQNTFVAFRQTGRSPPGFAMLLEDVFQVSKNASDKVKVIEYVPSQASDCVFTRSEETESISATCVVRSIEPATIERDRIQLHESTLFEIQEMIDTIRAPKAASQPILDAPPKATVNTRSGRAASRLVNMK